MDRRRALRARSPAAHPHAATPRRWGAPGPGCLWLEALKGGADRAVRLRGGPTCLEATLFGPQAAAAAAFFAGLGVAAGGAEAAEGFEGGVARAAITGEATAAAARRSGGALARLVDVEDAPLEVLAVELLDGFLRLAVRP